MSMSILSKLEREHNVVKKAYATETVTASGHVLFLVELDVLGVR